MSEMKFIISIPAYNVEKYIEKCLTSVKNQTDTNFKCVITNDCSEDSTLEKIQKVISEDSRFFLINNDKRKDVMENTVTGIAIASPDDEDVIVNVDGDDWLIDENVLAKVRKVYEQKKVILTYGNYRIYPSGQKGHCSQYSQYVIDNNLYRKDAWRASHLRTFKYKLWKNIREKDLKHPEGHWMFPCADQAYMLPMLEMSGGNFHFFEEPLYTYNRETSLNANKDRAEVQRQNELIVRSREPYNKLY